MGEPEDQPTLSFEAKVTVIFAIGTVFLLVLIFSGGGKSQSYQTYNPTPSTNPPIDLSKSEPAPTAEPQPVADYDPMTMISECTDLSWWNQTGYAHKYHRMCDAWGREVVYVMTDTGKYGWLYHKKTCEYLQGHTSKPILLKEVRLKPCGNCYGDHYPDDPDDLVNQPDPPYRGW